MTSIKLIVGLGNPGAEYVLTRHNAGFWLVDEMAYQLNASFKAESKYFAEVARAKYASHDVFLLKPQTFMNRSGQSIGALAGFYKIHPEEILVLHDELDLPPGTAKLKFGGGHGGHNGLKSTFAALGNNPNFWRLRIGIGHPGAKNLVTNFVLKKAPQAEQRLIDDALWRAKGVLPEILTGDMEKALRILHTAV